MRYTHSGNLHILDDQLEVIWDALLTLNRILTDKRFYVLIYAHK